MSQPAEKREFEMEIFEPSADIVNGAHADNERYLEMYQRSVNDPEGFWAEMAERISWFKKPTKIKNTSFEGDVQIKWYEDGVLNACFNCVDRHLPEKEHDVALIWEGDDPAEDKKITFGELKAHVSRLANAMKARGVKKGDRVTLYMPWCLKQHMRCWLVRVLARCIRLFLGGFLQKLCATVFLIATHRL